MGPVLHLWDTLLVCSFPIGPGDDPLEPRLLEFIHLFNRKEFFEAHEVLEGLWLESSPPVKDFYKGLIQCAVAFVHLQRNNFRGAKKLFKTARGYLHNYVPQYEEINTEKLLQEFEAFFATIVTDAERSELMVDIAAERTPMISTRINTE